MLVWIDKERLCPGGGDQTKDRAYGILRRRHGRCDTPGGAGEKVRFGALDALGLARHRVAANEMNVRR